MRPMAILGIDVGGTFTDAVLLDRGQALHREGADPRPAGGVRDGRRRGCLEQRRPPAGRALHARDDRRDECPARAQRRVHAFVARRGSSTSCTSAGRIGPISTGSTSTIPEPLVPLERCFGVKERIGPDGVIDAARSRLAARGSRGGGGRGLPSLLVPRSVARGRGGGGAAAPPSGRARRRVARGRTGVPRVRTRLDDRGDAYLAPVAARYLRSLGGSAAAAGLPEPLVMRSSGRRRDDRRGRRRTRR